MRVHFIAIGGSAMHNLALAMHASGHDVTGSDDEIFEPSLSRLRNAGILPDKMGWDASRITSDLDAVILGMHARNDNQELIRARELGLSIQSYPEFIYSVSQNKKRVVIGGSHGKTTVTSMIMHVLKSCQVDFDYLVGAQLEGFERMVRISDAPLIVIEGDEYLSSPLDLRPKFHWYRPHVAIVTGIAWDHINVFPTWENYLEQFDIFLSLIEDNGVLVYNSDDTNLVALAEKQKGRITLEPYATPPHVIRNGVTALQVNGHETLLQVFGKHNLQNLAGAMHVCMHLGISKADFLSAISTFQGAAKRLEKIAETQDAVVFKDFAHAPSKLKAALSAVREQFPERSLTAVMELHTFSSLNKAFLSQYAGCMDPADRAIVYFNPHTIEHKRLEPISTEQVKEAFGKPDLEVFTDAKELVRELKDFAWQNSALLLMTSGNFEGVDLNAFGRELLERSL
ncbi:MAG: peptidoglycan synthetase [Flavobacteriales bacterium]|nr:peptidoglycan synthetase [Flavobacteriales bacterium]MCB9448902.1 peptidoglycan synthetase [Flavobacteriales bacterium]